VNDAGEYLPREGEFDPLADGVGAQNSNATGAVKPLIECWSPSQLKKYEPPANQNMVGDFHIQRGLPTVLGGPPGCGKTRAATWLAAMGARGTGDWFGLPVHCQFRTLIIQCENSLTRLHRDFVAIEDAEELDAWIRVTSFPPYRTFKFADKAFRDELKARIREFKPQLIVIDPWNRVAKDSMQKDFQEALEWVCEVMEEFPDAACLILHHLRKPKAEDRQRGRALANLLTGSNVLEGAARAVLVMQPASDDVEDVRVVMTTAKNNDGQHGKPSAWERKAGWFEPVKDFDFTAFESGGAKREAKVREEHLREVFNEGRNWLSQKEAASRLQQIAEVGRSSAYDALKMEGGRFSTLLMRDPDTELITFRAS
jgi:hypothetical protein